jgi:hypothetical protein
MLYFGMDMTFSCFHVIGQKLKRNAASMMFVKCVICIEGGRIYWVALETSKTISRLFCRQKLSDSSSSGFDQNSFWCNPAIAAGFFFFKLCVGDS